jgi:hemerythrin
MGMWKNAYAIGNDLIDEQHQELFRITDDLVAAVRKKGPGGRDACAKAVVFLNDYVVKHFADEETLQASLGYADIEHHKKLHSDFVDTVSDYAKRLDKSNFDPKVVQQLAGKLIGWLIYHVICEDGKITGVAAAPHAAEKAGPSRFINCFADSACEVLGQMLNIPFRIEGDAPKGGDHNDISVRVELVGDHPGAAEFVFPLVTALRIVHSLTMADTDDLGEMTDSALREIANIISGNAASKIAGTGCACDIRPPELYRGRRPMQSGGKRIRCELGHMTVLLDDNAAVS